VGKTTNNAARVLEAAGVVGVNVVKGQASPLLRPARHDPGIHGESGLDGTDLLPTTAASAAHLTSWEGKKAINQMYDSIVAHPGGDVHLVATGALTNVALLLLLYPEVKSSIKQIVLMGGAIGIGNRSPVAEFNILCDPEAASIVFECDLPVVMVPLEVTHTALATEQVLAELSTRCNSSKFSQCMSELLCFFKDTYLRVFQFPSPPVHDPCAIAWLLDPTKFEHELMRVDVECTSPLGAGQTICDVWHDSKLPKNVSVAKAMNVEWFWGVMLDALEVANSKSPIN
jgi:purine nucleosidase